jgi:hypothetical protein
LHGEHALVIVATSPNNSLVAMIQTFGSTMTSNSESTLRIAENSDVDESTAPDHFYKSFLSEDHEHGLGIVKSEWTPDSRFFVFITEHGGGHSPMMHPMFFWDTSSKKLFSLDRAVGGITTGFSIRPPDVVSGYLVDPGSEDGIPFSASLRKIVEKSK